MPKSPPKSPMKANAKGKKHATGNLNMNSYSHEFKVNAVCLTLGPETTIVVAERLGMPAQTLNTWRGVESIRQEAEAQYKVQWVKASATDGGSEPDVVVAIRNMAEEQGYLAAAENDLKRAKEALDVLSKARREEREARAAAREEEKAARLAKTNGRGVDPSQI